MVSSEESKSLSETPEMSNASTESAARRMIAANLHHLVVLDAASRPVGVVSALDLLTEVVGNR